MGWALENVAKRLQDIASFWFSILGFATLRCERKKCVNCLVVEPTHLKNMLVKSEIFPNFRGEKKNI